MRAPVVAPAAMIEFILKTLKPITNATKGGSKAASVPISATQIAVVP